MMAESWIQGRRVLEQDGCWHQFNTNWNPQSAVYSEEGKGIQCKQLNCDVARCGQLRELQLYMKQQAVQKHGCKVVLRQGGPWVRPLSQSSAPIQSAPLCSGPDLSALLRTGLLCSSLRRCFQCFSSNWGKQFQCSTERESTLPES